MPHVSTHRVTGGTGYSGGGTGVENYIPEGTTIAHETGPRENPTYTIYKWANGQWVATGDSTTDENTVINSTIYDSLEEATTQENINATPMIEREDYGMEVLNAENFLGKSEDEAYQYLLDTKYGGVLPTVSNKTPAQVEAEIRRLMSTYLPKMGQPSKEETGFLAEQYGGGTGTEDDPSTPNIDESQISFADSLTGRTADLARKQSSYALQGQAGQVGSAMSNVYGGGTATSMRAGITGQEAIKKGFDTSQDIYALAGDTAGLGYRKGIYGLEEKAEGKWESDFTTFLDSLPSAIG